MRSILIALFAFTAGVLLMFWASGPGHRQQAVQVLPPAPTVAATVAAPAMAGTAAPGKTSAAVTNAWPTDTPSPEQVMYSQPGLMQKALADMTPRVAGRPNLYLVAFAGDAGEDVFRNEAEYAARLFAGRFGAAAHSVVLENNPATVTRHPLASWSNLDLALDGIGKVMQPNQDILVLYITSHGSEDHYLLVDMDPLPLDQIGAEDLAGILARHHFKWKVVVVNACYSGGFIPSLHGAGTMTITAARSDRSSFGCGSDSNATYFGKAFLVDALNHTDSFADAFALARAQVGRWEKRDSFTPSEPQIDVGSGIERQLALWRKGLRAGPAVPFTPTVASAGVAVAH